MLPNRTVIARFWRIHSSNAGRSSLRGRRAVIAPPLEPSQLQTVLSVDALANFALALNILKLIYKFAPTANSQNVIEFFCCIFGIFKRNCAVFMLKNDLDCYIEKAKN